MTLNRYAAISRLYCRNLRCLTFILLIAVAAGMIGCKKSRPSMIEPMRYKTVDKLKERLKQVAEYGDGGSSLGGIPESIDELMKNDPAKGKVLREAFLRLDTATRKEDRKRIAQEMVDKL